MNSNVTMHAMEAQPIRSIRAQMPAAELPAFFGACFGEIYGEPGGPAAVSAGPPFGIYHAFGPESIDVEVAVPVTREVPPAGRMTSRVLPAGTVARILHVGPYEALAGAYDALLAWVAGNGFVPTGPMRERYLNAPDEVASPAEYRTEVEVPVVPAPVAVPA